MSKKVLAWCIVVIIAITLLVGVPILAFGLTKSLVMFYALLVSSGGIFFLLEWSAKQIDSNE